MHNQPVEITRVADATATPRAGGCGCGHNDTSDVVLDVHSLPRPIRHAAVVGAMSAIGVDQAIVLVAPHDPVRMLAQIAEAYPDAFDLTYLERGPETWRPRLARRA